MAGARARFRRASSELHASLVSLGQFSCTVMRAGRAHMGFTSCKGRLQYKGNPFLRGYSSIKASRPSSSAASRPPFSRSNLLGPFLLHELLLHDV
jgi:hypothetical protein